MAQDKRVVEEYNRRPPNPAQQHGVVVDPRQLEGLTFPASPEHCYRTHCSHYRGDDPDVRKAHPLNAPLTVIGFSAWRRLVKVAFDRMPHDDFLPHIEYEVRMLMHTARRLSAYPDYDAMTPGSIEKADHDAYLESFLIHARVIHEFFRPESPSRADDIRAWQVCPDLKDADGDMGLDPVLSDAVLQRINKQLAHPTTARVTTKQPFPIRDIATAAVAAVVALFLVLDDPKYAQLSDDLDAFEQDDTVTWSGS
ncbi:MULTISPECIES: hypothetical protein [Gordonia]|uniref:Uncharacterized protein n=1 Tax=Gordonia amicalis TaxID=89053 RepID=A0AAE4U7P9_9ACTN|nr:MULTISPECIES: hypothetical protein [Gordonia]MCZ4577769.1 hypothetical protein [Gordonia amicalis]MDJ0451236.1 hypothetical protein [Gordonia amicalis]MDV6310593.1 hypothetical protein [Gordonia amicalis]MDV7074618.1 hypothetical protein [Gordonia amicalis]UKO90620.1 hypothetical protein IHQ52_16490 [Gordonia amicalis]